MKALGIFFLSAILLLVWGGIRIVASERYDMNCGGYLARAATANTVPLAKENLDKALHYLESHDLTQGYTSIAYKTPDEDIGFFYNNLVQSRAVLEKVPANADELTVSNTLLKLHNSIMTHGEHGDDVIAPSGISIYPANTIMAMLGWIAIPLALIGFAILKAETD